MQDFPHHYAVSAASHSGSNVEISSPGLPTLASAGPAQFGGPGDQWSPETLFVAAIADCFILSFKAIARISKMDWISLSCDAVGELNRIDRVTKFTGYKLRVLLEVPEGTGEEKAMRLLEKAERTCLITNSLITRPRLDAEVKEVVQAA